MFKSLIQPLQLFIKGATGKDRHQNQQLIQQLMRLEMAYDALQEDYTSLEKNHSGLKAKHAQIKARYDHLSKDQQDLDALLTYADNETKKLVEESEQLRSQIKHLVAEKTALAGQVTFLEHKLHLKEYSHDYDAD